MLSCLEGCVYVDVFDFFFYYVRGVVRGIREIILRIIAMFLYIVVI